MKEKFKNWIDTDVAQHELGLTLSIFSTEKSDFIDLKHIFWSANPLGDFLYETLVKMVELGHLEMNEDQQFRWKSEYVGV